MDLLFLGTGAALPSRNRSTSCVAVRSGRHIVLFDCGEGSQRQLMISPFSFMKIRSIMVSHLHGDHVFGLPCLLQTMGLSGRTAPLTIYGPEGIAEFVETVTRITEGEIPYPLEIIEVHGGERCDDGCFVIDVIPTDHGIRSFGYVLREHDLPGRIDMEKARSFGLDEGPKLVRIKAGESVDGVSPSLVMTPPTPGLSVFYSGDTKATYPLVDALNGVDAMIHESTYMESESSLADSHNHTTALQAARIARDTCARFLLLTHISNRYGDRSVVESEARSVFDESYAVDDMDFFEVTRRGIFKHD